MQLEAVVRTCAMVLGFWVVQAMAASHDPELDWYTIESPHFILHYHNGEEALAKKVAVLVEEAHQELTAWLNWQPANKTEVIISDESDFSNGQANVFPSQRMMLFVAMPDDVNSLEDHDNWLRYLIRHEYLHVLHLDKVRGLPKGFQNVFGRHPLLFPNEFQPRWMIEGIATYAETDQGRAVGRGQSAYFDMLMRMEVDAGLKPVTQINQPLASWPIGHTPYLYGVYYYQFLKQKYGEAKLLNSIEQYSDNLIPFRINSNSQYVFGKNLENMWREFEEFLKQRYQQQFATIATQGESSGERLTHEGYFAGPLRVLEDGRVFFIAFRGNTHAGLYVLEPGKAARKLVDVNGGSRFDIHPQQGILLVQPELCRNTAVYSDLYRVDLDGKHLQRLTHCGRYHQAVWSADGQHIVAGQHILGESRLVMLDHQAANPQILWQEGDTQLGLMAMSPDGQSIAASVWRKPGNWNLETFNLAEKSWKKLTDDGEIQMQPQFTADGKYIVFSAETYFDQFRVYNIHRIPAEGGQIKRITGVKSGAFYPAMAGETLYYVGYTASGFDVFSLKQPPEFIGQKHVLLTREKSGVIHQQEVLMHAASGKATEYPASAPVNTTDPQAYSPVHGLWPRWWFPHLLLDDQRTELGAVTAGNDALNRHLYGVDLAYDVENKWWVGSFDYIYNRYWPIFRFTDIRRTEIYLDNNDNPSRLRQNDIVIGEVILPFFEFQQQWTVHAAAIKDQEKDVWTASGVTADAPSRDNIFGLAVRYNSAHRYPKSVSPSEGRSVRLIFENSDTFGNSDYAGQVYVGDWREYIHLGGEHVLALRYVQGSGSTRSRPFRLGGIQAESNPLAVIFDSIGEPLFNRRDYTLRGYDEGYSQLTGRNMRLASIEYRFPIARVERGWMTPPLGLHQMHGNVFIESGAAWRNQIDKYYSSTGFEFNADVDLFYDIRVHTTIGFAHGFDDVLGEDKVYLRVGHNF